LIPDFSCRFALDSSPVAASAQEQDAVAQLAPMKETAGEAWFRQSAVQAMAHMYVLSRLQKSEAAKCLTTVDSSKTFMIRILPGLVLEPSLSG
jgi:hypothetical protein